MNLRDRLFDESDPYPMRDTPSYLWDMHSYLCVWNIQSVYHKIRITMARRIEVSRWTLWKQAA